MTIAEPAGGVNNRRPSNPPFRARHSSRQYEGISMKFGVLGSGMVGSSIAGKLVSLGHEVKMGSRSATNEKAAAWVTSAGKGASQGTFADAAAFRRDRLQLHRRDRVTRRSQSGRGAEPARQDPRRRRKPARLLARDAADALHLE